MCQRRLAHRHGPSASLASTDLHHVKSEAVEFSASVTMIVIIFVAVIHVDAVTSKSLHRRLGDRCVLRWRGLPVMSWQSNEARRLR